jgi:azurin/glucose/arabinose dehydrogenase
MNWMFYRFFTLILIALPVLIRAQSPEIAAAENVYYKMQNLPFPTDMVLEGGGLCMLPDGRIALSTRRGEIWLISNPYREGDNRPQFKLFASGMHELLGLVYHNGAFICAQRGELTRVTDTNGDEVADKFECIWKIPTVGHYHEFSFGPALHPNGDMYITLCVGFGNPDWWAAKSFAKWRGWMVKVSPDGKAEPYAAGLRSPCGLGFDKDYNICYSENQGDWVGSGHVTFLDKGDFTANPAGLIWASDPLSPLQMKPTDIKDLGLPLYEVKKQVPALKLPSVWLPHGILGTSSSEIVTDRTGGKFGPFEGQLFVGDQGQSKITRVFTEKVKGVIQGCAFPFREGFESGVVRICFGKDGRIFAAQTSRGWSSSGPKEYALQSIHWTGKMPFEMKEISARPDGFEITFTMPVDEVSAKNPDSYSIGTFIYKHHAAYGSPAINHGNCPIKGILISEDKMKVRLVLDSLRQYYIHEIKAEGVKNINGLPLLHTAGYYTLNEIPDGDKVPQHLLTLPKKLVSHNHHHHTPEVPGKKSSDVKKPNTEPSSKVKTGNAIDVLKIPAAIKRVNKMPSDWKNGADRTITIGTTPGMKYDKIQLELKAGERVKLIFNNYDDMSHNLLIVKPGTADKVGETSTRMGARAAGTGYVPVSDDVLFHTSLLDPASSETIYFQVPDIPGLYQYVCTVPGHYKMMRGVINVKK